MTRGDPTGPLRWTSSSAAQLTKELGTAGHRVSERTVNRLLREAGYSLHTISKTLKGHQHPDRNAQFRRIQRRAPTFQELVQPVVSVDTKELGLAGLFSNGGRKWHRNGEPVPMRFHDIPDKELGKAIPCRVSDVATHTGWVSVGVDHHTAAFAVETFRRWWKRTVALADPRAQRLLITAGVGGSNRRRNRKWKWELQRFAGDTGFGISVCGFPPCASK